MRGEAVAWRGLLHLLLLPSLEVGSLFEEGEVQPGNSDIKQRKGPDRNGPKNDVFEGDQNRDLLYEVVLLLPLPQDLLLLPHLAEWLD